MTDGNYVIKTGVVAMLDLLGIGALSAKQCVSLLCARDEIMQSVQDHDLKRFIKELDFYLFGDTILFCMESKSIAAFDNNRLFVFFLNHLVTEWIDKGFLIRGAVAYGEYVLPVTKSDGCATVIGPAVAEVARWYEAIDWAGIVIVPSCSQLIEDSLQRCLLHSIRTDGKPGWFQRDYIPYDAPLSDKKCEDGRSKHLWCLGWPIELRSTQNKKIESKSQEHERIIAKLEELKNSISSERIKTKYSNTIEFVRHCGKGEIDLIPQMRVFYENNGGLDAD